MYDIATKKFMCFGTIPLGPPLGPGQTEYIVQGKRCQAATGVRRPLAECPRLSGLNVTVTRERTSDVHTNETYELARKAPSYGLKKKT